MCGIAGVVDFNKTENVEQSLLKIRDSLFHRGPDDFGIEIYRNDLAIVGLAHRRLSIIDLSSSGNQPMSDETGKFAIVFNGEVYNYKELRKELEEDHYEFTSTSDTEVVLKAYMKWGVKAVERFIGMFAFAIYDQVKNKMLLFRDRAGVKPLYYSTFSNLILFGSELKALVAHPAFRKDIDRNALGLFFRRGWIPAPYTIFESTFKLKPGHFIEIDLRNQQVREHCYWDVHDYYNMEELPISFNEAKDHLHELLKSACEYRMIADTEVGIFLSGGFDSSLVTAILQTNRTKKINTFSIGFEDEKFNEAPYAKAVAEHLGTNHHELICTAQDALQIIPSLPEHYDEPFADSSAIPTMLVSKLASKTVKVALSADGGDEVFGGYPRYYDKLTGFNMVKSIPTSLRKPLSQLLSFPINLTTSRNPQYKIRVEKLKKSLIFRNKAEIYRYRSEPIYYSDFEIRKLISGQGIDLSIKTFYDDILLKDSMDPAMLMMAIEYKTTLADDLLVKVDRATMAYSLEGREPFLDHRLVEFSARLNSNFHYRNNKTKSLLREICYDYLPKDLMDRPKKGFAIPTNKWLNSELKELVRDLSDPSFIKNQNIFNPSRTRSMIENYFRGYDKDGERIWFFLMFQMWYNKWMTN